MIKQAGRLLNLVTPLGEDALLLESVDGYEVFSRPFEFNISMLSQDPDLDPRGLIGQAISVRVQGKGQPLRQFHGHVRRVSGSAFHSNGMRRYHATVVPWLWFLSRRKDCRIFQSLTVLEIVEQVFEAAGLSDYETSAVTGSYPQLEYCVQYNETDLDFVDRLLQEIGIHYYFRHDKSRHVLVLADNGSQYPSCDPERLDFHSGGGTVNVVMQWDHRYEFVSGRWAHTDYNFKTPKQSLLTDVPTILDLPLAPDHEQYEYPGRHEDKGQGNDKVKAYMEAEESRYEVVQGESNAPGLAVGGLFTLGNHASDSEKNKKYVVTALHHAAQEASYEPNGIGESFYRNDFTCIPSEVNFKPARLAAKARVQGPQTALVVGPAGEEIYTDKFGRIKVQFHWDRVGKRDENSSCWVRVAMTWAQTKWGSVVIPRIGQEVVVEFLEGDPDRPLITGCVYNADNMPPYDLPGSKTQSGFKSRSSPGGSASNFNELRFEDKKGSEEVYLQAEKDRNVLVKNNNGETIGNDETLSVGHDRTKSIANNETTTVGVDRTETVGSNETITVGSNRTEMVGANESVTIGANRTNTIGANLTQQVGANKSETIGAMSTETVALVKALTIGAAYQVSVGAAMNTTVGGACMQEVGAYKLEAVGGDKKSAIGGDLDHGVSGKHVMKAQEVTIDAQTKITLQCGGSKIILDPATITISGPLVKIN